MSTKLLTSYFSLAIGAIIAYLLTKTESASVKRMTPILFLIMAFGTAWATSPLTEESFHGECTETDGIRPPAGEVAPTVLGSKAGMAITLPYASAEFYPTHDAYLQGTTRVNDAQIRLEQNNRTGYLQFNISGISGTITNVALVMSIDNDTGDGTVTVSNGNSSNWTESNLSTANAPTSVSTLATRSSLGTGTHAYDLSVSNTAIYNGNLSLIMRHTGSNDLAYASAEHATATLRPKLVITYTPGPTVPTTATSEFLPTHDAYLQGTTRVNDAQIRLEQNNRTGYLQFNISGISGTITNVALVMSIDNDTGDGTVTVSNGNSSNWTESNLSTANAPTSVSTLATRSSSGTGIHAYDLSVSNTAIYNGNLSLIMRHTGSNDLAYASAEHATATLRPKLVITYSSSGGTADTSAPSTPTNLAASNLTSGSFTLNWNASTDNVGVTGYKVYSRTSATSTTWTLLATTSNTTSQALTGLSPSTAYYLGVSAFDMAGNESARGTGTVTTPAGSGPSVSKLVFTYDTAGNQTSRQPPATTLKAVLPEDAITDTAESFEEEPEEEDPFERSIAVYPNPTKGDLAMEWDGQFNELVKGIEVFDMAGRSVPVRYAQGVQEASVDLTRYPPGVYLVNFNMNDGTKVIKKIIKN